MINLPRKQIEYLLKSSNVEEMENLLKLADTLRAETVKNQVCIHGIIEFSNYCHSLCKYCGINAGNKNIVRYRMPLEEIRDTAINAVKKLGYKMIVLQSGEDFWYDTEKLVWLIKSIKKEAPCLIFLSIGNRDYKTYEKLYKVGAKGSLFRFETSDKKLYQNLHPDCSLEKRLYQLNFMKEIGYLVASGPIIGLPGQTIESLVNDIYLMKDFNVTMASMGPFIPTPNTPLLNEPAGSVDLTLKMIALIRLVYPKVRIPITTALEKIGGMSTRVKALNAGANAFMLNLTPAKYREHYEIYPDKNKMEMHLHEKAAGELKKLIESCGRKICLGWGKDFTLGKNKFVAGCKMLKE